MALRSWQTIPLKKKNNSPNGDELKKGPQPTSDNNAQNNNYEQADINNQTVQEPGDTQYKNVDTKPVSAAAPEIKPQPAPATPPPGRPSSGSRKLSMNILDDLTSEITRATANQDKEQKILSKETADQLFEKYKQQLQAANKNVIYAQFTMMRVDVLPPDELRIISPSELTDTYAKEQRTSLIDFYRAETKMIVRITTEIQEDESVKAEQNKTVLSKSEMYEAMAQKNPQLTRLKEGLGMSIEY